MSRGRSPASGSASRRDATERGGPPQVLAARGSCGVWASWTKKNSPSRLRFRPPSPRTFAFRLLPSGAASTYSRSVLGARRKIGRPTRPRKEAVLENAAFCAQQIVHISTGFPAPWGQPCGLRSARCVEAVDVSRGCKSCRNLTALTGSNGHLRGQTPNEAPAPKTAVVLRASRAAPPVAHVSRPAKGLWPRWTRPGSDPAGSVEPCPDGSCLNLT
jgi:hypothetical protein